MKNMIFSGQLCRYDLQSDRYLDSCGKAGDLSALPEGCYYSMVLWVRNRGDMPFRYREAYVRVDGGEAWHWRAGVIGANKTAVYHIYPVNMRKCMQPGPHTAVWYFDQVAIHREEFYFFEEMPWEKVFPFPTRQEIDAYKNPRRLRSPYLGCWLHIPPQECYTEYKIDFRAGHLPSGTYCCLGAWKMDHESLKQRYRSVRTESGGVHGYAGFQRTSDGRYASIMSFWDVFCMDHDGTEHLLRAKLLYPQNPIGGPEFTGEGTGARCIALYEWEAGHWYRMHLRSYISPETGTTFVEQWVVDLHTGERSLLCCYDTQIPDSCFRGPTAIFLENFMPETAGEVRSMEACYAMYRSADNGCWEGISGAYMYYQDSPPYCEGSYRFGAAGKRMWMITSGVGGDWFHNGKGIKNMTYSLNTD